MRTFLAIPLPRALCEELAAAGRAIEGLRAQKPETLHLTIRFLGEIDEPERIGQATAAAATRHEPFELALRGIGAFPDARAPRVVWVGVGDGAAEATALAGDVDRELRTLGIEPERRPYRAHITLGRFRGRPPRGLRLADPDRDFGRAPAERLILYESTLTPRGSIHEPRIELSLGRAN